MRATRRLPPHAVDRPALRHRLDVGLSTPLTVLVAPAGAGKTVLLAQWAASHPELAVAWVDVSPADDDSVQLAGRIIATLRGVVPGFDDVAAPLGGRRGGLGSAIIETLSTALRESGLDVILILDDLHSLTSRAVVEDLVVLADRLPPNAHLVFSSRSDLWMGWGRHRLQHGLIELRQADLALDEHETAALLEKITGRPVDESTAVSVMRHTEGWAAGVQLAGLALRFHTEASLVETLDETDRLVADYLSEQVLDAQTPERRQALLALSVLDELSAGLVQAVADVEDGSGFLRDLEHESMFVMPLPGRHGWYRFHRLFRDLLHYRLRAADTDAEARLLRIAADWHLDADDSTSAIECLLRARLWTDALGLILQRGRAVYERGQTATVAHWLSLIPPAVRRSHPDVDVLYAIMIGMTGRAAEAEDIFHELLSDPRTDAGHRIVIYSYLAAAVQFRPHAETYLDDAARVAELLEAEPEAPIPVIFQLTDRDLLTTLVTVSIGRAHFLLGHLDIAQEWLERALATTGARYSPYRVHALGSLALVEAWNGRLTHAAEHADEALELAREASLLTHPGPADAYLARAVVAIQRGEPRTGAIALHQGTLRAATNQRNQLLWVAHFASKLIDPSDSDPDSIQPSTSPPPIVRQALVSLRHRLTRLAGDPRPVEPQREWSMLAFEEVAGLLTRRQPAIARERLERISFTPDRRAPVPMIEHRIACGWLLAVEGDLHGAREEFTAALDLAEPEWLLHPFVRAGADIARLIDGIPGMPTGFRRAVVQQAERTGRRAAEDLIEPLTSRELEILVYLPTRLTNTELAERCYVSVNTIKTHIAHIYRKLDVAGRTAAVARARELGLIDTSGEHFPASPVVARSPSAEIARGG